ncbi:MAG: beta-lactamase family protein [Chloroflexi bacterium]|nr:beta-lactamase family protein [Chloroflexota bacterium]
MALPLSRPRLLGLAVLLALVSAVAPPSPAVAGVDAAATARLLSADRPGLATALQRVVDAARLEFGLPGVSVAVRFPDGSTWTGVAGLADVAAGIPVTPETPFALASISKPFVAGVVMGLVEDGTLHLGDSVARLLPGVRLGSRGIDPRITIRQLLDHTSGLRDHLTASALDKAVLAAPSVRWSIERALQYVGKPLAAPGTRFYYSNTNYILLGLIVERVTQTSIVEQIHERWITPLGLTTASYQGFDKPASTPAVAYRFTSNLATAVPIDVTDGTDVRPFMAITTASGPAGSLMASASDTARWLDALVGGESLSLATVGRMVADARRQTAVDRRVPYGLGLQVYQVDGRVSLGHSGRLLGERAVARHFPDAGITIVVLTNQSRTDPAIVLTRLVQKLLPWRDPPGLPAS